MEPYAPYPLNLLRDGLHRRRWWFRLVLAILLVPYLGHFAYTRWTTPPPLTESYSAWNWDAGLAIPPPEVDRTADLVTAIQSLPPAPTVVIPTTAPAGYRWVLWERDRDGQTPPVRRGPPASPRGGPGPGTAVTIDFTNALVGTWTPETRLQLGAIVRYFESPAARDALDRISSLSSEPFSLSSSSIVGGWPTSTIRELARRFTARARYHMIAYGDFSQAARDAQTVLQLSAGVEDDHNSIWIMTGMACRALALDEVRNLSCEFALTRAQVRDFVRWLERHRCGGREMWRAMIEAQVASFEELLDFCYTDDDRGNGWLTLHRVGAAATDHWILRSFDLLSPLFEDRRTTRDVVVSHYERLGNQGDRPYAQAKAILGGPSAIACGPTLPVADLLWNPSGALPSCLRTQVEHDATVVALALSAYRAEHGQYPQRLSTLTPDYMSVVPADPFSEKPLRYRLDDRDGYVVYSVGQDTEDNGGIVRDEAGTPVPGADRSDLVFPGWHGEEHRDTGYQEWVLVDEADTDESER